MYRPLPHGQCTRVLEILESNPSDHKKLVLRMTVVDVGKISPHLHTDNEDEQTASDSSEQRFDALSYTWGAPSSTPECEALYGPANDVNIGVTTDGTNEYPMKIGRNLYEALLQIYMKGPRRPLWVDAICINQNDLHEKEKHILLMSEIYSKAERVIVWLGKDDHTVSEFEHVKWFCTTVFDDIEKHVDEHGDLQRSDFGFDDKRGGVIIMPMDDYFLPSEALNALYHFYARRRYFSRAWVMQEVVLSHDCLVLLEEHVVGFARLSALPLQLNDLGGISGVYVQGDSHTHPAIGTELVVLGENAQDIHDWKSSTIVDELRSIFGAHDDVTSYLALLEYLLSQGSQRAATNPLDLIYCLLGIAKALYPMVDDPVKPDYTATVDHVYTSFTAALLERLPYRTILSLVNEKPLHADYVGRLPSWVPDFVTSTGNSVPMLLRMMRSAQENPEWRAGFDDSQFSSLTIKDRTLSLFGRRCAPVNFSSRLVTGFVGSLAGTYAKGVDAAISIMETSLQMVQAGMSDLLEPMFRVVCWGAYSIEKAEDFRMLWRKFLAGTVLETRRFVPDKPEVMATICKLKTLFDSLPGIPLIPSDPYLKQEEETAACFDIIEQTAPADATKEQAIALMKKLGALWPEHFKNVNNHKDDDEPDETAMDQEYDDFVAFRARRLELRIGELDTFFTTSKGQVGRISASLQPGDELWLLCQARTPFVLRPTPTGEYRLLGGAFVHGAMLGELIENGVAEQAREINIV